MFKSATCCTNKHLCVVVPSLLAGEQSNSCNAICSIFNDCRTVREQIPKSALLGASDLCVVKVKSCVKFVQLSIFKVHWNYLGKGYRKTGRNVSIQNRKDKSRRKASVTLILCWQKQYLMQLLSRDVKTVPFHRSSFWHLLGQARRRPWLLKRCSISTWNEFPVPKTDFSLPPPHLPRHQAACCYRFETTIYGFGSSVPRWHRTFRRSIHFQHKKVVVAHMIIEVCLKLCIKGKCLGWQSAFVWSDMHSTHLLVVCQPPHQLVECVVGQSPEREISHHCLDHSWVSLRETLCPGFNNQFPLDVLLKEAQKFSLFHSYVSFHGSHFEKRAPKPQG